MARLRIPVVTLACLWLGAGAGAFEGIGVGLAQVQDSLFAIRVFPNSPAAKAGMRDGDVILTIDGRPARGMSTEEAAGLMRGLRGTRLNLTVRHMGETAEAEAAIVRDVVEVPEDLVQELAPKQPGLKDDLEAVEPFQRQPLIFSLLSEASDVAPGAEFEVSFHVFNSGSRLVDAWQAVIEYDPPLLDFCGYYPHPAAPPRLELEALQAGARVVLRPRPGAAALAPEGALAQLVFRAREAPGRASVRFARDAAETFALHRGADALGETAAPGDGLIDFAIEVAPAASRRERQPGAPTPQRPPRIVLSVVAVEGTTDTRRVLLTLSNPDGAPVARLKATLFYDPSALEALDCDRGNWIRSGLNIADGPYHGAFAFDFHHANTIDSALGRIDYDMGALREPVRSQGVFAHADFRARGGAARSVLLLRWAEIAVNLPRSVERPSDQMRVVAPDDSVGLDWVLIDFGAPPLEATLAGAG